MMHSLTVIGLVCVLLAATGCGWLFKKQRKPLKITVTVIGTDSLNFDGNRNQPVQVKVYVLKRVERFLAADVRAFFDPEFDPGFMSEFGRDTLGSTTLILAPGETTDPPVLIEIPYIRASETKPSIAVIANFAQPPRGERRERWTRRIKLKNQKICVELNSNWVEESKCP